MVESLDESLVVVAALVVDEAGGQDLVDRPFGYGELVQRMRLARLPEVATELFRVENRVCLPGSRKVQLVGDPFLSDDLVGSRVFGAKFGGWTVL
jgi:DNA-binding response OmpR family regulator